MKNACFMFFLSYFCSSNLIKNTKNMSGINKSNCTFVNSAGKTFKLYGKVQIVTCFPDVKVQIVNSFEELDVKLVDSFPDKCGKFQIVQSFPDVKVQIVDSFPDIKVKIVDSFPGLK